MMDRILEKLPQVLLPWFSDHRRDLPWRTDREPYHIWISEIMLQQTRVEAVKGYYTRFLEALPSVQDLANAEDDRLKKLWEGLGYYSRVKNLKKAAQMICRDLNGRFPDTYEGLLALPGIGEYTAGAIGSIAFELPTPGVDGNVLRVISRLCLDATPIDLPDQKKRVRLALEKVYPRGHCGDFTQALMELGATVCLPNGKPRCAECPCGDFCRGLASGQPEKLPVRLPKKNKRTEELTVFVLRQEDRFALRRRESKGLLAGLWEFPNTTGHLSLEEAAVWLENFGLVLNKPEGLVERKHIFTHVQWQMRCFYLECSGFCESFTWVQADQIRREIALPTAFRQFWDLWQKMTLEAENSPELV